MKELEKMIIAAASTSPPFRMERMITVAGMYYHAKLWKTDPKMIGLNLTANVEGTNVPEVPKAKARKK